MAEQKRLPVRFSLITAIVWLLVAGGLIFLLWQLINRISAGNLPVSTATPDQTQIYQTIVALLTPKQENLTATASPTSTASPTNRPTQLTALPIASQNLTPTSVVTLATPTTELTCDRAAAGNPIDVSIPDDSLISPGQSFIKTWRLMNNGSCTWTSNYSVSFFYGDRMQAPAAVALNQTVYPAQSVDISIEMEAPRAPGTYQGNWKLSDPQGTLFGIGPNGDAPFWVRITVPEIPSNTATATPTATVSPAPDGSSTPEVSATASPTSSPTPTSTPPVQASGELTLVPGESVDLDSITKTSEGDDLDYQADSSNYHWLVPKDDARIGVFGQQEPNLAGCQVASMSRAQIAVESLSAGTYLCYSTQAGRFGRLLMAAMNADDFTLTLDLLTWALP